MKAGKIQLPDVPERRERCHIRGVLFIQDRRHIDRVLAVKTLAYGEERAA